jgi:hypothetical protein
LQAAVGGGKKAAKAYAKEKQAAFQHPWLLTSLKGHSGRVLDISLRYLIWIKLLTEPYIH